MMDHTYRRCTVECKQFSSDPDILANLLSFIIDPLYRVRIEGVKDIEGNGLGLAIVKSIVEQHGGQISVESEQRKGSCFTFSLPLIQKEILAVPNLEIKSYSTG